MKMKGFQVKSTCAMSFLLSNVTRIKGGKMRRTILAWRIVAVAGLMLFALSACASRQTTAPTMTDDQTTAPSSEISNEEALARQQALEEQQRQEEADRRQFESERNRFVYEDIFFARNQYRLDENARREMEWKAAWLLTYPDIKVLIEGHCDEGGRPEDNLALGMRRAIVPVQAGVLSALGMLAAPRARQLSRTLTGLLRDFTGEALEQALQSLADAGIAAMREEGIPTGDLEAGFSLDLRLAHDSRNGIFGAEKLGQHIVIDRPQLLRVLAPLRQHAQVSPSVLAGSLGYRLEIDGLAGLAVPADGLADRAAARVVGRQRQQPVAVKFFLQPVEVVQRGGQ